MIKEPSVAGMFYPENPNDLKRMIDTFLSKAKVNKVDTIKAIIVPHAGYKYSGQVAAYAYKLLSHQKKAIIIGPSHYVYMNDIVADINTEWKTPLGAVELINSDFEPSEAAFLEEHSVEVQIPFLQSVLKDFKILPLVAGDEDPKEIANRIEPLLDNETILVISSDLSHFLAFEDAIKTDKVTCDAIKNLDYDTLSASGDACGKVPILAVIELANKLNWKIKMLEYKNSGDTTGDKSKVVGYMSAVLYV